MHRSSQNLAGLIAFIVGAVGLVLLIVLAIWIAVGAVRFGIEVAAPYR